MSTGISQRLRNSSTWSFTASRNRTSDSVMVANISSRGLSVPKDSRSMPPSPISSPSPRNRNANDSGDLSTSPDASGATIRTAATRANPDVMSVIDVRGRA